ncbi:MAG: hypothetical protein E7390_08025 [Ruminococcaceae bacterium]|nr:hypothetical protein [Oscillospiraceae bacterium]
MKKVSVILAVLLALSMFPAVGTSANENNLIVNPSFTETIEDGTWFAGWNKGQSTKASVCTTFGHADNNSIMFSVGESGKEVHQQYLKIDPSKDYHFSFYNYRNNGTGSAPNASAQIYLRGSDGTRLKNAENSQIFYNTAKLGGKNAWNLHEKTFYASDFLEGTAYVDVAIRANNDGTKDGVLYIDDVSFAEIASDVTYTEDEETGTITVGYNAYCPSSYKGDAPRIIGVAALYKTDGVSNTLAKVVVSPATQLIKADFAEVTLGSFEKPADNATYTLKVFSLDFENAYAPFEEFPVREVFR